LGVFLQGLLVWAYVPTPHYRVLQFGFWSKGGDRKSGSFAPALKNEWDWRASTYRMIVL
jgi:hypothetical protein